MKITVCGAGTLGGNLAENLARTAAAAMAGKEPGGNSPGDLLGLTVIDGDRVEARNLANQPYSTLQLGQPKPVALAEFLYYACGVQIEPLTRRLTGENATGLLRGADLVVDAFDNSASRAAIQASCRRLALPCLHLGLSQDDYGEVRWDEAYIVPPDPPAGEEGGCRDPLSRTLALLVVSLASEAIRCFRSERSRRGFTVTMADLAVVEC